MTEPMANTREEAKLEQFRLAILKKAQAQRDQILAESQAAKGQALQAEEDRLLEKIFRRMQQEIADLKTAHIKQLSQQAQEQKRRLYAQREEYLSQLRAARIPHLPLLEVPYQLTVHQSHPLAGLEELPFPLPEYYTALLCENDLPFSPVPRKPLRTGPFRTVTLQDTALLLELLGQLQGAYTLTVPLPQGLLRRRQLVQRPCPAAGKLREEVIYRGLESLSPEEQLFLRLVQLQP